ncbi:deoxyribonuclease HsdR [Porphyromonas macacae]|uniref:Do family serine endopeptidase n=1 Tax=Porphyromonas macacae TaxID=28115 RepID=UPI00052BE35B|nr:Do family serine endopeptidase [Porphyromonas macacae]KGN99730.1 deoxyribonuclease HsdR [Porphyromonas macacae]
MNKILKVFGLALGVIGLSAATTVGTYKWMQSKTSSKEFANSMQTALPEGTNTLNKYGFQNAALESGYKPASVTAAPNLVEAAEKAVQAVVHIRVEGQRSMSRRYIDPFEYFFGNGNPFAERQMQPVVGFGSGVIVSSDGYIITNNHVIDNGDKISVTLNDNRTFSAKLIGTDPATDIAVIKIEGEKFPSIPFGNSDNLQVGEWVLAVGNPFNFTSTVTAGIVSAKSRNTYPDSSKGPKVESFIQTDAAVNRGNSGGALVNAAGELVGINSMIFSETGNYAGISFAIPITIAAKVAQDLKTYGNVQRAVLGFSGTNVTDELIKEKGLKVNEGVFVADFSEISAVYAAGIEKNDVITAIDGQKIKDFGELQGIISRYRPGDVINVTVDRFGQKKDFSVSLKNKHGNTKIIPQFSGLSEMGIKLRELSGKLKRTYGVSYGVEVTEVTKEGKFAKAGVKKGFIVLSINDQPVYNINNMEKMLSTAEDRGINKLYVRGFYPNGNVYTYLIQ